MKSEGIGRAKSMHRNKPKVTLTINSRLKRDFQVECNLNGVSMSETTEFLWYDYIKASRALREEMSKEQNLENNE